MFSLNGSCIGKFGTPATGRSYLNHSCSLAIDTCGLILVTEHDNNGVSIFNKDGTFIHCFGCKGSAEGQFSSPSGIALGPDGSIYICDSDNKRI